ncbi:hypothetical protein FSP39_003737 [Pinctada imbricata]|uniref:U4/U6.U5 small nuclear ribonucleoprotein 27 kDa protein n=1 Tax=Pinctada imbricata TaxID=66713 RepID=A0AA89C4L2_PINIB|nr:hypothetical protein FSP39_003737 [Pinctada imbricata]
MKSPEESDRHLEKIDGRAPVFSKEMTSSRHSQSECKDRRDRDRDRYNETSSKSSHSQEGSHQRPKVKEEDLKDLPEEEAEMIRLMGFGSFDTTKGKKVEGNDIYCANIPKKRRYRQYMNRRGGFNRPLDFIA